MRIFVLGSNGMIGRYVLKYFKDSIPVGRDRLNALLVRKDLFYHQMRMLNIKNGDVVINCVGITNKRNANLDEFLIVNSIFPRTVADFCEDKRARMIHITTDCVFNGDEGFYDEENLHNAESIYGMSKSLGEPPNATVIRTSLIGENPCNNLDLLEWVLKHRDTTIEGWTNHYWNGITCLQFAKVCDTIILHGNFWRGVRHVFSPVVVSKADIVDMINDVYELGNTVKRKEAEIPCNRSLTTNHNTVFIIPPIREQIIEQKNWIYNS